MASRSRWIGFLTLSLLSGLASREARAQQTGNFALDQFQPAPSGDDFFAIQGYRAGTGKIDFSGMILGEYARNPLVVYNLDSNGKADTKAGAIVSDQLFLHVGASIGFYERIQLSLDFPIALVDNGGSSGALQAQGQTFSAPTGAAAGDLRGGLRLRLLGDRMSPFGAAITGYIWFPTGDDTKYAGDGSVRGSPGLALGGRVGPFLWGLNGSALLRKGTDFANTHVGSMFDFGGGVGAVLLDEKLQLSAEAYGGTVIAKGDNPEAIPPFDRKNTNLEALFGLKGRLGPMVLGGGAGPGLTSGPGTPSVRAVLSLAYAPIEADRDHDGVLDKDDACPDVPGVRTSDPATNGCPSDRDKDGVLDKDDACPDDAGPKTDDPKTNGCPDRDKDGILDKVDACPDVAGVADPDPKKNGCPAAGDRDKDGIVDEQDACPDVAGVADPDPAKNGCPPDRDGDGITDDKDACPDVKGVASDDPQKNGCPPDTDGDGITDDQDACPTEKGLPDPDPKKNGCPRVFVSQGKIQILEQVQFKTGSDVILPESDDLLGSVARVFKDHPEITKVLVEGHTDDRGDKSYNKGLSERRAASVKKWLLKHGVEGSRLESRGFGQDVPIGDNTTDEGRQKNRRVEFKILGPTPAGVTPAKNPPTQAALPKGGGTGTSTPPPRPHPPKPPPKDTEPTIE